MISVEGLQAFADQLSEGSLQSLGRTALEKAAEAMVLAIGQIIPTAWHVQPGQQDTGNTKFSESISSYVDGNHAVIGSTSSLAIDLELGSTESPPKPFLVAAAQTHAEDIVQIVAETIAEGLGHNDA